MAITKATASSIAPAAKGDLVVGSATNDAAVLGVGANDTVLTADSTTATGLKWAALSAGANWSLLNTGGTTLTGSTVTVSGISGKDKIMVLVESASTGTSGSAIRFRVNTLSTSIYTTNAAQLTASTPWAASNVTGSDEPGVTEVTLASMAANAASNVDAAITLTGCNSSGVKQFMFNAAASDGGSANNTMRIGQGFINTSATIASISILTSNTFDAGTVFVYTSA
jgi:hypothetical protein